MSDSSGSGAGVDLIDYRATSDFDNTFERRTRDRIRAVELTGNFRERRDAEVYGLTCHPGANLCVLTVAARAGEHAGLDATAFAVTPNQRIQYRPVTLIAATRQVILTATAQGGQAADTNCATLTLSTTGARGSTGGGSKCW